MRLTNLCQSTWKQLKFKIEAIIEQKIQSMLRSVSFTGSRLVFNACYHFCKNGSRFQKIKLISFPSCCRSCASSRWQCSRRASSRRTTCPGRSWPRMFETSKTSPTGTCATGTSTGTTWTDLSTSSTPLATWRRSTGNLTSEQSDGDQQELGYFEKTLLKIVLLKKLISQSLKNL